MSLQGFCTVLSVPEPVATSGRGTDALTVTIAAPVRIRWADGSGDDTYPPGARAVSVYDLTSTAVDGAAHVWLVLAVQGTAHPWFLREMDYLIAPTTVPGSQFAVLWRADGGQFYSMPQV